MREGMYLGRPPVPIRASAGRQLLISLMRGITSFQAAAGPGAPLAMPALQVFRSPASQQADPAQAHLYPLHPGLRKQALMARLGSPAAPTGRTVKSYG